MSRIVTLLAILFIARPASATITVVDDPRCAVGGQTFGQWVRAVINDYYRHSDNCKHDTRASDLIQFIDTGTPHVAKIICFPGDMYTSFKTRPTSASGAMSDRGSDSTIKFDPNATPAPFQSWNYDPSKGPFYQPVNTSCNFDTKTALIHELIHAAQAAKGADLTQGWKLPAWMQTDMVWVPPSEGGESGVLAMENLYRNSEALCQREYYHGIHEPLAYKGCGACCSCPTGLSLGWNNIPEMCYATPPTFCQSNATNVGDDCGCSGYNVCWPPWKCNEFGTTCYAPTTTYTAVQGDCAQPTGPSATGYQGLCGG